MTLTIKLLEGALAALAIAYARRSDDRPYAALVSAVFVTDIARFGLLDLSTRAVFWYVAVDALGLAWWFAHLATAQAYRGRSVAPVVAGYTLACIGLGPLDWLYVTKWKATLGLLASPRWMLLRLAGVALPLGAFFLLVRSDSRRTLGARLAAASAALGAVQMIWLPTGLGVYRGVLVAYLCFACAALTVQLIRRARPASRAMPVS